MPHFNVKIYISIIIFCAFSIQNGIAGNIIDTTDYSYWRELSGQLEMFRNMKKDALQTAKKENINTRDIMASNALAYILDPTHKNIYVNNIKNGIENNIKDLNIGKGAATSSVPSNELFHGLLALDVIRYDLEPEDLARCENILETKIFKLVLTQWRPHGWALRMLWYKYTGDEENFAEAKKQYDIDLRIHFLPDGVSPSGNGYNMERFNVIERSAKNTTFDIMEYMGYHEYYSDPGLRNMHEWIYGYANSPFGRCIFYGDSRGSQIAWTKEGNVLISPTTVRTARFSDKAYKYSMWLLREGAGLTNPTLRGYLASYIVMAGPAAKNNPIVFNISDAEMAPSRIFNNYAALIGKTPSRDALYLSVLSLRGMEEYHTHYEANAIGMAGYGEILLRNAGYDGPNNDVNAGGITTEFNFIHANAESANTILIGGENHSGRLANGIMEGMAGEDIEYFRALNNISIDGEHFRDVLFVQPSHEVNGYYIVMDHVTCNKPGEEINVIWHPNSAVLNTIQDKTEYHSKIEKQKGDEGPVIFGKNKPELTTFLGTVPASVIKKDMVNQSRGYHYRAQYIYTSYPTINKKADILTVLFPGDKTHKMGKMTRIVSGEYTGSKITQNQVVEVALVSDGKIAGENGMESFKGEDIFYRKVSGKLDSYFVKGMAFDNGNPIRTGFDSDSSVALYLNNSEKGMQGKIISTGANLSFYYPEISSVKLDGIPLNTVDSGSNWLKVIIPEGIFAIELDTRNDQ